MEIEKTKIKECAEDIWFMIPDKARLIMTPIKDQYIDAVIESIENTCVGSSDETSENSLHKHFVSNNEVRVAVGCHTCKHNPHAPFIPEICDKCKPRTLSEWQPN